MNITENTSGREDEIVALFKDTFTASEGAEEGALIGGLARDLLSTTPPDDIRVFSAEVEGDLVGCGVFTRLTYPEDSHTVVLLSPMAVATPHQKRGIGQRLLRHALRALRDSGVDVALTYGDPVYYGQVGFEPITEEQARAPQTLSFPHGWIGQSLTGPDMPRLKGPSRSVPALDQPHFW